MTTHSHSDEDSHEEQVSPAAPRDHGHDHPHDPLVGPEHGEGPSSTHTGPAQQAHAHDTASQGDNGHDEEHDHGRRTGVLGLIERVGLLHSHSHATSIDNELESNEKGIRAVKQSLVLLAATAGFQIVVVIISGSVALLADTIHNFTDALTALPLWLAFILARRPASRRYTHGYGRTEDVAGIIIVLIILLSALVAGYESYMKLQDPTPIENIEWVIVAAIVGFLGNEFVAALRIRVGKEIGSAALVADGQHARVDGLTSLAVLFGAIGVLAGAPIADPLVGAVITVAILFITKDAALLILHRLLDGTDPELLQRLETTVNTVIEREPGAHGFQAPRLRWLGHRLQAELILTVDAELPTHESHRIAEEVRHALFHVMPSLGSALVHVDPWSGEPGDSHDLTSHHTPRR